MNTNRMINMAMRMLMRFGMRWMRDRSKQNSDPSGNDPKDRREFRGKQPGGDAAKRMRALKRMNKF